ncbi:MAG TPA: hypothetical protein VGC16_11850 [Rhizomicrobium sp.]
MGNPFTPEQIASWRTDLAAAKKQMEDGQRKMWALQKVLEGASMWEGIRADASKDQDDAQAPENFMGTLERIANDAPAPLSRKVIKKALADRGFSEKQLGNYFYSVVARLKEAKRITVMDNGDLWRKPK